MKEVAKDKELERFKNESIERRKKQIKNTTAMA